jgi:4-amino-4-deoxy-L-arabinose transferase-like glycosyltransferase
MKKSAFFLFVLVMSTMTLALFFFPGHNGDMPFYIASIVEKEGVAQTDAFQKTSEILDRELPESEAVIHKERLQKADSGIMNFYKVKPLYISIISIFHRLGCTYILSTVLPSLIAYFFIGILVFFWASRLLKPGMAFLISILIMLINPLVVLSRLSSPDALSCLSLLGALFCIYFEKNRFVWLFLLFLSIWVRMDNFISVLIILSFLYYQNPQESKNKIPGKTYVLLLLLVCAMLVGMNAYLEQDFWWFSKASYLASPRQYGMQLLVYYLSFSQSFLIALILFFVIIGYWTPIRLKEKTGFFLLMIACIFATRLILFPSFEERFAAAYYIFAIFLFIDLLNSRLKPQLR